MKPEWTLKIPTEDGYYYWMYATKLCKSPWSKTPKEFEVHRCQIEYCGHPYNKLIIYEGVPYFDEFLNEVVTSKEYPYPGAYNVEEFTVMKRRYWLGPFAKSSKKLPKPSEATKARIMLEML